MKAHGFTLYLGPLWFGIGWYPGDPFKLFCITVCETSDDYHTGKIDFSEVLSLQIAYFSIGFGWRKREGKK